MASFVKKNTANEDSRVRIVKGTITVETVEGMMMLKKDK